MRQFRIRTIMLLIAVIAVATTYYTGQKSIKHDLEAIEAMHFLAPQLLVRNQNEYACLQIERTDFANHIREYHCFLPSGRKYNLNLLWSKEFALRDRVLQPETLVSIPPGTHQILLTQLADNLTVSVNGEEVINVPRKRTAPRLVAATGANDRFQSQWYSVDQPLTLARIRESDGGPIGNEAGSGIALWIEATD